MQRSTNLPRIARYALFGVAAIGLLAVAGCGGRYRASATVSAPSPRMVYVDPGVWVVANRADPVFYSDGAYYRYDNGVWYRSGYLGGWSRVQVGVVPRAVVRIDRPRRYRNYRVRRGARVRAVPRAHVRVRARSPRRGRAVQRRGRVQQRRGRAVQRRGARVERRGNTRRGRAVQRRGRRMERRGQRTERRGRRIERRGRRGRGARGGSVVVRP